VTSGTTRVGRGLCNAGGTRVHLLRFVCLDVVEAIDDSATDFQKAGPLAEPPPALERPRRDAPAIGELNLVEMSKRAARLCERCHPVVVQVVSDQIQADIETTINPF